MRECNDPVPENGGQDCAGDADEGQVCEPEGCPGIQQYYVIEYFHAFSHDIAHQHECIMLIYFLCWITSQCYDMKILY